MSPSMRREWIEISVLSIPILLPKSPSMRREWIEIHGLFVDSFTLGVSLHAEGVD